jgi:bifunctional DNA-binding transcriptional regulator/antitoxin component of YhaV-PrlF toxin-antitoxin module
VAEARLSVKNQIVIPRAAREALGFAESLAFAVDRIV